MPLKLRIKRRLTARSERVKSTELHPTQPWMLTSLYNGQVHIWNIDSKQIIRSFEVSDLPVRTARFIARKNWVVTGADDTFIRVFNYNTSEHVTHFAAHMDYIRSIAVHPSSPVILSTGDDGIIKLWNWEKKWACTQMFKGHTYLVMQIVINPKDNNQFATASLDRSVKVWQFGSSVPNFSLKHERDVNCVDYHPGGDKPYIVSGEDGGGVRIWDYQTKSCVQSLQVHSKDVNTVVFHPSLPIILSGASDGTLRVWHSGTYRLENTLNYGLERVWSIACQKGSNNVALGFDEGSMIIRIGHEEPAMSMDSSGKIIWAKHSEIQQANIKAMGDQEIKDGERLSLAVKDMGSCEIYPQTISHSPNGRFAALCGDGEYIIYTAMALRNKSYGSAFEFVWSNDSSMYAVREGGSSVKIFKNFKEHKAFKPTFGAEGIYGGHLLGIRSSSSLSLFDWDSMKLIRTIEITPKHIFWSENGELMSIATDSNLYILKYNAEAVENAKDVTEDGIEEAFEVVKEMEETVLTGLWVGDCFIFTNSVNRLNYYVGGEIVTIAHLDRVMYLLGYIPKDNRLYLGDKELSIVSYSLLVSVLEYQTAVMRRDFDTADKVLTTVPKEQRTRVALFLEQQGFKSQALAVTTDTDHKFDLAIQLSDLREAYTLARQCDHADKWKQLSDLAIKKSEFGLAQECLHRAKDYGGLMLLATCAGHKEAMCKLAQETKDTDQNNIAFVSNFVTGRCEECLDILIKTKRLPEAAFFARTYLPSQVSRMVLMWKEEMAKENKRLAAAISDPAQYENLFPDFKDLLKTEQYLQPQRQKPIPAAAYPKIQHDLQRNPVEEMHQAEESGRFLYTSPAQQRVDSGSSCEEEDNDGFVKVKQTTLSQLLQSDAAGGAISNPSKATPQTPPRLSSTATASSAARPSVPVSQPPSSSIPSSGTEASKNVVGKEDVAHKKSTAKPVTEKTSHQQLMDDLEDELSLDLEGVNLDDFDMADLDLDDEALLND